MTVRVDFGQGGSSWCASDTEGSVTSGGWRVPTCDLFCRPRSSRHCSQPLLANLVGSIVFTFFTLGRCAAACGCSAGVYYLVPTVGTEAAKRFLLWGCSQAGTQEKDTGNSGGWVGCRSMVEYLPDMCDALGLIGTITKNETKPWMKRLLNSLDSSPYSYPTIRMWKWGWI